MIGCIIGKVAVGMRASASMPSLESTLGDALSNGNVTIIINPTKSFAKSDISSLHRYVENGGYVLIMDTALNKNSTATQLLSTFGMKIVSYNETLSVVGGKNINISENITFSVVEKGKGMIGVVVDSYTFSNAKMGTTFTIPNDSQKELYNAEFCIFETFLVSER